MKLSIITINLNNLAGLQKTVESVLSQSWREFEYIIIDGASTDESAEYLMGLSDPLIMKVSEPDHGIYDAMNKGIDRATGDYLLFLNSGDYLVNERILEKVQRGLTSEDIVYGDLIQVLNNGKSNSKIFPDKPGSFFVYEQSLPHPAAFIKRDLFNRIGKFDINSRITADWQFFMKALFEFGCTSKHLNFAVTIYPMDGISSQADNLEIMEREKYQFLQKHPQVLQPDFFRSLNEGRQIFRFLAKSRIINLIFSLGLLGYLKNYLKKNA